MDAARQALCHPGDVYHTSYSLLPINSFFLFSVYLFLQRVIPLQLSAPNPLFSVWFWRLAKVSLKFKDQSLVFLFDLGRVTLKVLSTVERFRAT